MVSRFRISLAALALLALAGCDWGATTPISIELRFDPDHTLNADGTCDVQFVAQAAGIGSAEWLRVVIRRSGAVQQEFVGAQTAQFWGAQTISAGERQESTPFRAPDAAANVLIDVHYRITGPERTTQLRPDCRGS